MQLTQRRMQLLHQLIKLYQKTNLPIHYETLAASLGVSKWTAYDMLKEIEKLGFVSRSYEVNAKETGRSQVVFTPTAKASRLFDQERSEHADPEAWKHTVGNISGLVRSLKNNNVNESIRKLMDEIPATKTSLDFCGYIIGVLLVYLKKLGGKTEAILQHIINKSSNHDTGVIMFVGTVLGTILQTVNDELGFEIAELVSELLKIIDDLSIKEKDMLSAFLREALV